MTERERWVVYPLLFLALGAALRDKLVDRTITKSIVCEELTIVDQESPARILAKIGRTDALPGVPSSGYAVVHGEVLINGVVDAKQYVWQRMPILPMQVAPGVALLGVLQTVPQTGPKTPTPTPPKAQPPSQPPAGGSAKDQGSTPPSSPADKQSPPAK